MIKYSVNPPWIVKKIFNSFHWETKNNKILLTFDDAPTSEGLPEILELLDQQKIKALFFCVGENIKNNASLVKDILSAGHTIGNHTMKHQKILYDKNEVLNDLKKFNNIMEDDYNYKVEFFRPPHGRFNFSTRKILDELNLQNVMWSLLTYDYKNDFNIVKFTIDKYLKSNSIIVLHDNKKSHDIICDSIKYILETAEKRNYSIGEPSECLK